MAQLKAGFTADKSGGCSPLTIFFTNNTAASSSAVYEWDFGNGNTSSLKNPGAVFLVQKEYTVTLTVKDGNQTSSTTQTVTVYQKPVVDFSVSSPKVCTPDPVTFTGNATADKGNIVDYIWDFGDGFTGRSYGSPQMAHTYLSKQKPPVTLSVTDNHGCTNSKTINNIIEVIPGVTASFGADKTFICFAPDPVTMINSSTSGEGALSCAWDFGDGVTSSEKNPTHSFNKKGIYSVKLSVESTTGCKSELTKTSYLNVGEFKSQMNVPDFACQYSTVALQNSSIPTPTSYEWMIDGVAYSYYYVGYYPYEAGEHTIQLTNKFGTCEESVTKKIIVNPLPQPKGFITQIPKYCFPPVTVNFQDTTTGAVKSEWNFYTYAPSTIQATGKTASYNFEQAGNWNVTLFVTDANGCRNSVTQPVTITQPYVSIQTIDNNAVTCESLTKKFKINSNRPLASFTWNFGDGTTSTEAEPEHTFTTGSYNVTLKYTTTEGCSGVQVNPITITVYPKPKADFSSVYGTIICGNSYASFVKNPTNSMWDTWYVGQQYAGGSGALGYTFSDTGKYSITLITANPGCSDTMTKTDYITVLPSFPKITQVINTCDGDRGTVTFAQASRYANKWTWDFGDGTKATYNTDEPQITHHYSQNGSYNVVLSTANNQCVNKTSAPVIVFLKEHPVLSSAKTTICSDEQLNYTLTGLNTQTYPTYYMTHYLQSYQYNDGTTFYGGYNWITSTPFYGSVANLQKGKDSIRVITSESYFGCLDTTNFIPIKIKGAVAGFEIVTNNVCFKTQLAFRDTSKAENTTIISRQWDFGDGQTQTVTEGGAITHLYVNPGNYYVTLRITDASGCTSTTSYYTQMVSVNGPKAAFSAYGTTFHLNSTIQFYNNTNNYNSYNTQYEWQFGDGSTSGEYNPSYTYTKPGNYKIRLIAKNPGTGCADTAFQDITVKNFNANFSFTSSFVNSVECAPTLVQFNNTSYDYFHVKWDFGDGFIADNVNYPSHVYTMPGKYIIKLFVTGYNGLSNTYTDSVIIKDNKVNITANMLHTCTSQSVTLSAITENGSSYLWDFGDGTLVQASDTFSVHYYKTPGNYVPKLIAKDNNGCAASVTLNDKISIDSLYLSLNNLQSKICTPKEIDFNPVIVNIAAGQGEQPLTFHWDFGTGNKADTSNIQTPSFVYQQPGNYSVSLKAQSQYGCVKEVKADMVALQGLGGQINGPAEICQESTAQFTGATQLPGQPKWHWIFDDGAVVDHQNPPAKKYDNAGSFLIQLIVDNSGCVDTISKILEVRAKPDVNLSSNAEILCEGSAVSIAAGGGSSYSWSPSAGLNSTTGASVTASPVSNTDYLVTATNTYGCKNTSTIKISVIHPFKLQLTPEATICSGKSVEIEASGAIAYQWIGNTIDLSNTSIANPVATPLNTTTYTVVGSGEKQCFTDTAAVKIIVNPSPVVDAGQGAEILTGTPYQLQATASNDVVRWDWSPSKYLSCLNCAAPLATPLEPMNYTVTVYNSQGCIAYDTVSIKLFCSESRIFIPNAFTPNKDGLNDVFSIRGQGISLINRFRIYNSWGTLIFERTNLRINDRNAGWDGRYKGEMVPMGTYVYIVEMSCNEKTFSQKGTITVIY